MQIVKINGEMRILGRNLALRLLLEKAKADDAKKQESKIPSPHGKRVGLSRTAGSV